VQIPQNLPPSLHSLHLEENKINNLTTSDFKNLGHLLELNLHGNEIPSLPPFVFNELGELKSLDLRSNNIDEIYHDSFTGLTNLVSLDLSQNPIKVIVTGAFTPFGKLSLFHASRWEELSIEMDPSSFAPMESLQILTVEDSPSLAHILVTKKEDETFPLSTLPSLMELNLQRCDLHDINLVTLSLLTLNLQVVKLSGNPWDCQQLLGNESSHLFQFSASRKLVDEPECQTPSQVQGVKLTAFAHHNSNASANSDDSLNRTSSGLKNANFTFNSSTSHIAKSIGKENTVLSHENTSTANNGGVNSSNANTPSSQGKNVQIVLY